MSTYPQGTYGPTPRAEILMTGRRKRVEQKERTKDFGLVSF